VKGKYNITYAEDRKKSNPEEYLKNFDWGNVPKSTIPKATRGLIRSFTCPQYYRERLAGLGGESSLTVAGIKETTISSAKVILTKIEKALNARNEIGRRGPQPVPDPLSSEDDADGQ